MKSGWARRLPLLLVAGVAIIVWKGAFGLFPTTRAVVWQLPVEYAAVRAIDLQIWREQDLLKREERSFAAGVTSELRSELPLRRGAHRGIATVSTVDGSSKTFTVDFDPGDEAVTVVSPAQPVKPSGR